MTERGTVTRDARVVLVGMVAKFVRNRIVGDDPCAAAALEKLGEAESLLRRAGPAGRSRGS